VRPVLSRKVLIACMAVIGLTTAACGSDAKTADTPAVTSASTTAGMTTSSTAEATTNAPTEASGTTESMNTEASTTADSTATGGSGTGDPKTATSLADFGGMAGLEAAAKAEGTLNVIALPRNWANYGEVIDAFKAKYPEITVTEQAPNSSSAEEITAADTNKGTDAAPDVFDLGTSVTLENTAKFAPYKVAAWDSIPDVNKEPTGLWVNDYTGTMAIGYDSTTYGEVTKLDDLLDPKFKGVVALNGNPTEAGAAFNGVVMASLASGGSLDDVAPGVDYFVKLKTAGNYFSGDVVPAVVTQGEVGVVFDWTYNQLGYASEMKKNDVEWKVFVPEGAAVGSYYNQAINLDAPHPAAARLWQEFLFTPEAQNLWLKGGANPVLQAVMQADGTIDAAALAALASPEAPQVQTADQITKAQAYLKDNWSKVSG